MQRAEYLLIESWMIRELELSGNNLLVYALIYGFSRDGVSMFFGNYDYIMKHTGIKSSKTVTNVLDYLLERNLIEKEERFSKTGKSNGYKVVLNDSKDKKQKTIKEEQNKDKPINKIPVDENGLTENAKIALGLISTPVKESIKNNKLESYNQILDEFGVKDLAERNAYIEFIRHCNLNQRIVTNSKLEDLIYRLDRKYYTDSKAKVLALKTAINKGYFDIKD